MAMATQARKTDSEENGKREKMANDAKMANGQHTHLIGCGITRQYDWLLSEKTIWWGIWLAVYLKDNMIGCWVKTQYDWLLNDWLQWQGGTVTRVNAHNKYQLVVASQGALCVSHSRAVRRCGFWVVMQNFLSVYLCMISPCVANNFSKMHTQC